MNYATIFKPGLFEGRTVIITGGGSGIGRCVGHEIAALGGQVWLLGRDQAKLDAVVAEIRATGGLAEARQCDIRDEDQVRATVGAAAASGPIHGLVNNAGGQFRSPAASISAKGWRAVVDTNLTGGFLMAREAYVQSMQHSGGAIVNIAADFANGMTLMAHSGAARAGMVNLTETLAAEWAPVRINAVAPGPIASSGMDSYPPEAAPALRAIPSQIPAGRWGLEAEVSAAVVFLLSDAAAFISGACLRVDGGAPSARRRWTMPERAPAPEFDAFPLAIRPRALATVPDIDEGDHPS
ncbi:MAG: SDR family oxidoreductase [Sphingobium sp.]